MRHSPIRNQSIDIDAAHMKIKEIQISVNQSNFLAFSEKMWYTVMRCIHAGA